MKQLALGIALLLAGPDLATAKQPWQHGIWRDVQFAAPNDGMVSVPVAGMLVSVPFTAEAQYVTIDGPDGLTYVARWKGKRLLITVNDPIDFVVEGKWLYVRGDRPGKQYKLELLKTIRLPKP